VTRDRRPVHPRTMVRWLVVLALVVLGVGLVGQLRDAQPYVTPDFIVEGAENPSDPFSTIVTCERTLPDRPVVPTGERPNPVGRVTSSEVIECPGAFDGHVVVYIGEVIGDVLRRDGGAWVLVNDDAYALEVGPLDSHGGFNGYNSGLSVWLEGDLADLIEHPGGPQWRGDVLRLRGVVHRADPADGGGLTLRAFEGRVLSPAIPLSRPLNRPQAIAAGLLSIVAVGMVLYERAVARRR
jgi:hypothetical protein